MSISCSALSVGSIAYSEKNMPMPMTKSILTGWETKVVFQTKNRKTALKLFQRKAHAKIGEAISLFCYSDSPLKVSVSCGICMI